MPNKSTLNGVTNYYGPRHRYEGVQGQMNTIGAERQLVIHFSGDTYGTVTGTLPAGAVIVGNAVVEVNEAFTLGGTTPVINVGVATTEGTNRLAQLTQANAQAVGTYSYVTAGTLAKDTPLATAVTLKVALGGTTPTATNAGKAKLVVTYQVQ